MKKYLLLFTLLASTAMAGPFSMEDIPEDINKELSRYYARSSSEHKRQDLRNAQRAYLRLQNKAYDSGIPREDLELILNRLHQMYGLNFAKQSGEFDREVEDYKAMVARVETRLQEAKEKKMEEQEEAKKEIKALLDAKALPGHVEAALTAKAKEAHPEDLRAQQHYLEGACAAYQLLQK